MTLEQITEQLNTDIYSKTEPGSISPANVGDGIGVVVQELLFRGMPWVNDVAALKLKNPNDTQAVHFVGRGIYQNKGGVTDSKANDYNVVVSPVTDSPWTLVLPTRRKGAFPEPYTKYFDLPGDVFSGGVDVPDPVESITYAGEFVTAAAGVTRVGSHDQLVFTGGDRTSTATFNAYKGSDVNRRFRLRLRVDEIGSATSFVGFWLKNVGAANDAGTQSRGMYVNLNTGVIFRFVGASHSDITASGVGTTVYNGPDGDPSGGIASNGDLLEIIYEIRGIQGADIFTVNNLTTGHTLRGTIEGMIFAQQGFNQFGNSATAPSVILAGVDATYRFMSFDCESTIPSRPFLAILGDSMASGYNAQEATSLYGKLNTALQYNVAQYAAPGLYVNSQAATMREVMLMRSKYVFFFGWLAMYWGDFRDTDPDYATFYASWTKIMQSIRAAGGRPILAKYPPWPAGGQSAASQPLWAAFIDQEAATYDAIVVDLSGHTFNYNGGAGFHLGDADNQFVANELLKNMEEAGAFADL